MRARTPVDIKPGPKSSIELVITTHPPLATTYSVSRYYVILHHRQPNTIVNALGSNYEKKHYRNGILIDSIYKPHPVSILFRNYNLPPSFLVPNTDADTDTSATDYLTTSRSLLPKRLSDPYTPPLQAAWGPRPSRIPASLSSNLYTPLSSSRPLSLRLSPLLQHPHLKPPRWLPTATQRQSPPLDMARERHTAPPCPSCQVLGLPPVPLRPEPRSKLVAIAW